ncbi:AraC family transcriptional regulator [Jannaschia sp. CCS1]|uniref:AraC family transcriptional regulator n=1 Tax=Jannaschia sp. (strain CCS1) TaxID=290400 RepID=UPI000053C8E9|nr:AraC family transcriptional regulator [Jannaschia sp. CCS1]ABD54869.1 transcriptional regulator, AraC family [Jannaschia sp. CCS1]
MPLLDKMIWHIETQLDAPLTLETLADRCAVNVHHMCRAFQFSTGLSVMAYVRARRLSRAAHVLADGEADILTMALEAGYGSHEAFTRAFRAYLGVLPSQVKEACDLSNLSLMEPLKMDNSRIIDVAKPEIRTREAFRVVGFGADVTGFDISAIPGLWQRFAAQYQELGADGVTYGVSYDIGEDGDFRYIAGLEWPDVPDGMVTVDLPAARYAVFTHDGHIGDLPKMIYTIWNKALPGSGLEPATTPEFELYDHRFNAVTGLGVVEHWVPLV